MRRWLLRITLAALVVFALLQAVPYGWWHENPAVAQDAPWPDQASADLARTACYDCHSNETEWPAYSYVAPMSWLVRHDVEEGRDELNFSLWDEFDDEAHDAAERVEDGSMPPSQYQLLHPGARLTDAEVDQLVAAFEAMDEGGDDDSSGRGSGDGQDDDGDDDSSGSGSGSGSGIED
jgi:hypothetical protein